MKRIIAIVALLIASSAFAQRPPRPNGPPPPLEANALADYLGLTDGQKAAAETIHEEFRASVEPIHEQIRALHEQIKSAHEAADAKFLALLTSEQRARFEAFRGAVEFLRASGPGGDAPHR
ncbi:MAG TPA: periplasmic heavy metal sensor [Thermoanaerobaculia bacterium]|nr:periplasmic heavy metal sensor [Thermoanaerobaculia bacterium]